MLDLIAEDPRGADLEWLGTIPLDEAMAFLTSLNGVGPKTAACVMCFCFDAHVVPADTHVHRIALRTGIVPPGATAFAAQERLSRWTPPGLAFATHMRLIAHGRAVCIARAPRCEGCVLLDVCREGRRRVPVGVSAELRLPRSGRLASGRSGSLAEDDRLERSELRLFGQCAEDW